MVKSATSPENIKKEITALKGERVEVVVNLGRNKSETFRGVLSAVYPALFTVHPDEKGYRGKTAYSYAEYLCGAVVIERI